MVPVRKGQPLPLAPAGSVAMGPAACLIEDDSGGLVSIWGMATWSWAAGDVPGRRLAAVGVVAVKAATRVEVAAGFGVDDDTLRRWSRSYELSGVAGLIPEQKGPQRRSKLTDEIIKAAQLLRAGGGTLAQIADALSISTDSVRTAIALQGRPAPALPEPAQLERLAPPEPRSAERELAAAGLLDGAEPVITEGASLPFVGALLILPALAATGLLEVTEQVLGAPRAAFYALRSLVLCIVFAALLGECRAEGLTRLAPVAMGRLLGLDRGPEVKTLRRRMAVLAGLGRSEELLMTLARHHVAAHPQATGILYVDGHVRAYHGGSDLPRAHLARARIAMAASTDSWLADANGDAVLVWSSAPGEALTGELRKAIVKVRELLGEAARPTICFDRGGYSPVLFAELVEKGFDILTYRKGAVDGEPRDNFSSYTVTDRWGHETKYLLCESEVRLTYDKGRREIKLRQVTRLDPASGHQTKIITSRKDLAIADVAQAMFSRWRQENLFRFMRPRGLDAMDSYAKLVDYPERSVPNPAKVKAAKAVAAAKADLAATKAVVIDIALGGTPATAAPVAEAKTRLSEAKAAAAAIPARIPLCSIRPDARRLDDERKRLHDAIRMATWNAEATLARALGAHYARAEDEAHTLLAEAFSTSADLQVKGDELHVSLEPLSAPRRSRAIAALATELTATETLYPGTELRIVYSVKGY